MIKRKELRKLVIYKFNTIGAFADAIGVSRQTVSNIINRQTYPRRDTFEAMQKALDVSRERMSELIFEGSD